MVMAEVDKGFTSSKWEEFLEKAEPEKSMSFCRKTSSCYATCDEGCLCPTQEKYGRAVSLLFLVTAVPC